jgi:hypothetical protein
MHAEAASAWAGMTTKERRAVTQRELAGRKRRFARARATAPPRRRTGRWAPPFTISRNYHGYAIHAALLRTGKVLFWGYPLHINTPGIRGNETYAWLWDPARGEGRRAFEDVTPHDPDGATVPIYCSGMSFLPDGRLLVVGGNLIWPAEDPDDGYTSNSGLNRAFLFYPVTEEWMEVPRPEGAKGRYYPSQVLLPDGRTLVVSGWTDEEPGGIDNRTPELYRRPSRAKPTGSFRLLTGAAQQRTTQLYPHLFVLPNGKVALAGPNQTDHALFDPQSLAAPWTELAGQTVQRIGGNSVLLPRGVHGSYDVLQLAGGPFTERPLATTEQTDFAAASPNWVPGPKLHVRRSYPNTVLLPDQSLVVVGGTDTEPEGNPPPGRRVELLKPGATHFRLGPAQTEDRGYHSTALLLPDGRVLSAGDDLNPSKDGTHATASPFDTAEIYSPPYLQRGPRPVLRTAPRAIQYSDRFTVTASSRVTSAVLAAPSAVTHGTDTTERIVPLRVAARRSRRELTLSAPAGPNLAPPGWYMLFLMDAKGRPASAPFLRLHR